VLRPTGTCTLVRSHKTSIVFAVLLALLMAQAAAGLHVLKHFRSGGDAAGVPGQHSLVCLECASFAPVLGSHGGPATTLAVAVLAGPILRPHAQPVQADQSFRTSFRARAPPY
jgi:hypothetical protein